MEDKKLINSIELTNHKPVQMSIPITNDYFKLQIFCDVSWIPNLSTDHLFTRELGIGILNVSIR